MPWELLIDREASYPDPTHERRGSGDIRPIIPDSLTMIAFQREIPFANHTAENTICSATPEIFGYFSTMDDTALFSM